MSKVGTMTTGAAVETVINESYVPQLVLVGATDTALPLTKFGVSIAGEVRQGIAGQSLIQAFSKIVGKSLLGADVAISQVLPIANGFVGGQNIQVRLTNAGATTPDIFFFSNGIGDSAVITGQQTIQPTSNQRFAGFSHLIFDDANLDYVQIEFADGFSDKFTDVELLARFAMMNGADANGELAGMTVLENLGDIVSATIYTTAGAGGISVVNVTI
jgi:hypothetical protein